MLLSDTDIRAAFRSELLPDLIAEPGTMFVEELGLQHGRVRIDLAIVNGELSGFELKSDLDTLQRLPEQILVYNSVFDKISLIATERHFAKSLHQLPEWWGAFIVESVKDVTRFEKIRPASINPVIEKRSVASLLWRTEALEILKELNLAQGLLSKPRSEIYNKLAETLDTEVLCAKVRQTLRSRTDWRPDALHT